jgi:transcriptional regulator with XRE-family HTH domain
MSIISENIKYLRRLNGLTQEQFSRRIGVKRPSVGAYEEARAVPPIELLKHIAKLFGYTVDELVKTDIRRLKRTPDLDLNFDTKREEEIVEPAPIGDILKEFMQKEPPKSESINQHFQQNTVNNYQKVESNNFIGGVVYVKKSSFSEYLTKFKDDNFIKNLPTCQFPNLPIGNYRAFEAGDDFAFEGAFLVGLLAKNWFEIQDGQNYILVTRTHGIIHRRVYNQGKIKGTLLLSSDNHRFPTIEISVNEVLEAYQVVSFYSTKLPEPSISFEKMTNLVDELKFELERIKK